MWSNKFVILLGVVFFLQFYLAESLSINMIRPDFISIFILYTAIKYGRLYGMIAGFSLGLLTDLVAVGSYFGLAPMTYTIVGYLAGFLKNQYMRMIPTYFHLAWIGIVFFHFFVYCYVRYQTLFEINRTLFVQTFVFTFAYTIGFIVVLQLLFPLKIYYHAESN